MKDLTPQVHFPIVATPFSVIESISYFCGVF